MKNLTKKHIDPFASGMTFQDSSEGMILQDYLKYKPIDQVRSFTDKNCPLNTPRELTTFDSSSLVRRHDTGYLPPLAHSEQVEEDTKLYESPTKQAKMNSTQRRRRNIDIPKISSQTKRNFGSSTKTHEHTGSSAETLPIKRIDSAKPNQMSPSNNTTMAETCGVTSSAIDTSLQRGNMGESFQSLMPNVSILSAPRQSFHLKPTSKFENPSNEMVSRWKKIIEKALPAIDLIDLASEHNYFYSQKR